MNYAVDRLDRRARRPPPEPPTPTPSSSSSSSPNHQEAAHDKTKNNTNHNNDTTTRTTTTPTTTTSPLFYSDSAWQLWHEYGDALTTGNHEALGRTLRDVGWNRQAVYHYGQAWCQAPDQESAAADYAQMAELTGFPELGLLALLAWRAEPRIAGPTTTRVFLQAPEQQPSSPQPSPGSTTTNNNQHNKDENTQNDEDSQTQPNDPSSDLSDVPLGPDWFWQSHSTTDSTTLEGGGRRHFRRRRRRREGQHCGCGTSACGAVPCFVPIQIRNNDDDNDCLAHIIFSAMDRFSVESQTRPHASLSQLWATPTPTPKTTTTTTTTTTTGHRIFHNQTTTEQTQQQAAAEQVPHPSHLPRPSRTPRTRQRPDTDQHVDVSDEWIPEILRFWEQSSTTATTTTNAPGSDSDNPAKNGHERTHYRSLSPVTQLLLIKLAFSTFPLLALQALAHWQQPQPQPQHQPVDDNDDDHRHHHRYNNDAILQELSSSHKSHHAYYVLIRAIALGKGRVKGHQRKIHIPVWERVHMTHHKRHQRQQESSSSSFPNKTISSITLVPTSTPSLLFQQSLQSMTFKSTKSPSSSKTTSTTTTTTNELCVPPISYHRQWSVVRTTTALHGQLRDTCDKDHNVKPLFLVGDSHVLSLAWQPIWIPGCSTSKDDDGLRLAVPIVITGLKAWHVRPDTHFFTYTNLQTMIVDRLLPLSSSSSSSSSSKIGKMTLVISAGEIDCREGLGGPLLEGYQLQHLQEHHHALVRRTVQEYVQALQTLAVSSVAMMEKTTTTSTTTSTSTTTTTLLQILVMPVAPHAAQSKGRVVGQAVRRQTMQLWNQELRRLLHRPESQPSESSCRDHLCNHYPNVFFLDYEEHLVVVPTGGSNSSDSTREATRTGVDHQNEGTYNAATTTTNTLPAATATTTTTTASRRKEAKRRPAYVLRPELDADGTHMNSAFAKHFAQAIANCGCNLDWI
ncbi:hypothetical protein ACA910_018734 [Epithemia clementina (nom. ined.)]